jgi:hypothetical protein
MKNATILLLFILLSIFSIGQDTIDVVEKTIKVGGMSKSTEYYGFADGDRVIFNLTVENRKELKDITVSEYPNNVKFADHTTDKVQSKALNVYRNAVYVFEYYNSNLSGRTINVKIQRIPRSESTKFFNTNIKWVNRVDTTYSAQENSYLISSDTSIVDVIDSRVRVHSQFNKDNPNKTIVDFTIPNNTIKWTYWIGVGTEGQEAFQKDQAAFSKAGTKIIGSINPLAGLAFGLLTMTHANVGEHVKYYFMSAWEDVQKFSAGQTFMQFKNGNIVTDFGLMNYAARNNTKCYIGLMNDNMMQGIDVTVKILAVVVNNKYNSVIEKVPTYNNRTVPVTGD